MAQEPRQQDSSTLLAELAGGGPSVAERLMPLVYDELRALAASYMRQFPEATTLQPTALVHEAYLRLLGETKQNFTGRAHFIAVGAKVMRGILVDHARRKDAVKHGGDLHRVTLSDNLAISSGPAPDDVDVLALDQALRELSQLDERKSRVVEMRVFGGMSIEETALALGVARSTVTEDWRLARAWVARAISQTHAT